MEFRLYAEPVLERPVLIATWPGIGNIGLIAVDSLRRAVAAEELGEIEPWDFFYPRGIAIRDGVLESLNFPGNKFYYKRTGKRDLLFFIGEEQPSGEGRAYASGERAYNIANLVLDVAQHFGCRRAYTSGAAVARIHHTMKPRVWVVPNIESLLEEIRSYENAVLMSEIEGRRGHGKIAGLNGLLLGVAKKRGMEAICTMGEIPIYLQGLSLAYPKASESVIEVLTAALDISIEMDEMRLLVERSEREIDNLYDRFPSEIRTQLDKLKYVTHAKPTEPGPITEEDKKKILEEIDKFFKRQPEGD